MRGVKLKLFMKKRIVYTDAPDDVDFANLHVVDPKSLDLPTPQVIAAFLKSKKKKVTILLDPVSVAFFQKQAQRHGSKYQAMIREVVTRYAKRYTESHQ